MPFLDEKIKRMAVFANAITPGDWGEGLPRYMFSRPALTCQTVEEATRKLSGVKRSSARNTLRMDKSDGIASYENTPKHDPVLKTEAGIFTHTNHYLVESLVAEEKSTGDCLLNSQQRLTRMNRLLKKNRGQISVEKIKGFFCDCVNFSQHGWG